MSKKTGIYLRASTDKQTTESQKEAITRSLKNRGIRSQDCVWYVDEATSGATWTRTGLDALMADCGAGKVNLVIAYKLDRLGRSLSHVLQLLSRLDSLNIPVWFPGDGIDTSDKTPFGKAMLRIILVFAELERDIIRERTKAGMQAARERGSPIGRPKGRTSRKSKARKRAEELIQSTDLGDTEIGNAVGVSRVSVWGWRKELSE